MNKDQNWISIISFRDYNEAIIVQSMLEAEGIQAVMQDKSSISNYSEAFMHGSIEIYVPNSQAEKSGLTLSFAQKLDPDQARDIKNYEIETWNLIRSKRYGSDRYDRKKLAISKARLSDEGTTVQLFVPDIQPVDVMSIYFKITDQEGNPLEGKIQNTIHNLAGEDPLTLR